MGSDTGSIYHGTPFMADAARTLWRMAQFGEYFARRVQPEAAYAVAPEANTDAIPGALETLKALWSQGAVFGVWRESDIEKIPKSARIAICLGPLQERARQFLDKRAAKGLRVYAAEDRAWQADPALPRIAFTPEAGNLLVRRVAQGTLYVLMGASPDAALEPPGQRVEMALADFGMALAGEHGLVLAEGAGAIRAGGKLVVRTSAGRVICASEDQHDLLQTRRMRVAVTEPGTLAFSRPIQEVLVYGEGEVAPLARFKPAAPTELDVDDELARYRLVLLFDVAME